MDHSLLQSEDDVQSIHTLIAELPGGTTVPDLDELLQLSAVRAAVTAGLRAIRDRGAKTAELGTSSENGAMQRLAESLGFTIACESLWFSRAAH